MVMAFYGLRHGVGLHSKFKIVTLSMLNIVPWGLRKRHTKLDRVVSYLTPDFSDVIVEKDGLIFHLIDHESIYLIVFHEDWMEKYLKIREGDVFVDIGAHIGKYSIQAFRNAGRVIAIEADPDNYHRLVMNIELNNAENIDAVNKAAWHREETLNFHVGEFSGQGSLKEDLHDRRRYTGTIQVQAEAADTILRDMNVQRVDWVKIDVEGAEYEVLCGLKETIGANRARIIVELMKPNVDQVLTYMKDMDYNATPIPESESRHLIYYLFSPNNTKQKK